MRMIVMFIILAAAGLPARPAAALNLFELEVYPATTEGKGLHEVESNSSYVANGPEGDAPEDGEPREHRLFRTSLEYNYGLTDKIDAAMYLDFDRANADAPRYAGSRFRFRGAFFDKGQLPVDLGWYLEFEVPHRGPASLETEFKPLVSKDLGRFSIDLNPAFELPTVADERRTLEFSYAARIYYRWSRAVAPGIEFYGGIGQIRDVDPGRDQEHYVMPVVYARVFPGLKIAAGPGFGLTRGSDKVLVKLNVEYEFTLPFSGQAGAGVGY